MDQGYFGPDSISWRIWGERIQLLGATRAVLLQLARPLVAAGVYEHSSFQEDPVGRLTRTADTMLTIVFGTKEEADEALKRLTHVHTRVKGEYKGKNYSAFDPKLMLWVHATEMETGLIIYELFVGKLSPREKERFYEESKILAGLLRIPKDIVPPTFGDFKNYMRMELSSRELTVTEEAKKTAWDVMNPNIVIPPRAIAKLPNLLATGLLPHNLRKQYGLRWDERDQRKLKKLINSIKTVLPLLPPAIRYAPQSLKAWKRTPAVH